MNINKKEKLWIEKIIRITFQIKDIYNKLFLSETINQKREFLENQEKLKELLEKEKRYYKEFNELKEKEKLLKFINKINDTYFLRIKSNLYYELSEEKDKNKEKELLNAFISQGYSRIEAEKIIDSASYINKALKEIILKEQKLLTIYYLSRRKNTKIINNFAINMKYNLIFENVLEEEMLLKSFQIEKVNLLSIEELSELFTVEKDNIVLAIRGILKDAITEQITLMLNIKNSYYENINNHLKVLYIEDLFKATLELLDDDYVLDLQLDIKDLIQMNQDYDINISKEVMLRTLSDRTKKVKLEEKVLN